MEMENLGRRSGRVRRMDRQKRKRRSAPEIPLPRMGKRRRRRIGKEMRRKDSEQRQRGGQGNKDDGDGGRQ